MISGINCGGRSSDIDELVLGSGRILRDLEGTIAGVDVVLALVEGTIAGVKFEPALEVGVTVDAEIAFEEGEDVFAGRGAAYELDEGAALLELPSPKPRREKRVERDTEFAEAASAGSAGCVEGCAASVEEGVVSDEHSASSVVCRNSPLASPSSLSSSADSVEYREFPLASSSSLSSAYSHDADLGSRVRTGFTGRPDTASLWRMRTRHGTKSCR